MAPQIYALVDYWGRRGDVWKMISAYEVLVENEPAEAVMMDLNEGGVEGEEQVPTLSRMMAQEAEDRGTMGWFGWHRGQQDLATSTGNKEASPLEDGKHDHQGTNKDLPRKWLSPSFSFSIL